ncbi:FAD-dependent oxidoreductase [Sorangium sp. So ce327]|uniref:phytoene desaturase family protein n=1 Tax=Sorangium sp. So ce327 TaxID=3133301 RepID=UPI003F6252C1
MAETHWDAIVVGAGLSGMTASLELARRGCKVLLVERLARAGGRCGAFELEGHRFTVGCNDFGARIVTDLARLGVHVAFEPSTNVVDFGDETHRLPPRPRGALRLLRHAPSVLRMVMRVRNGEKRPLGTLFRDHERDGMGFRMISLLAYALGTPPQHLRADLLRADFSGELGYGHEKMVVPIGGPQVITDAMLARLRSTGVTLRFGTGVQAVKKHARGFEVDTSSGSEHARVVLSTVPASACRGRAGLKVCQVLFAVPRTTPFVDARTLIVSPPRAEEWMAALDAGHWPETFGFHLFRDHEAGDTRAFTGFLLAPRGQDTLDASRRARVLASVKSRIDAHVPGFSSALRFERLLDPSEYEAHHGVSASLAHEIPIADEDALPIEEHEPGLFRMGNATEPPGDHANAAMLSGLWAAERALRHLRA